MKKHDEGYVLAFVMVVIVVLCLVAVSLMSISLRNLEAQNASIQRMEHKYAAMGVVEQVVAAIDSDVEIPKGTSLAASLSTYLQDKAGITIVETEGNTEEPGTITSFTAKLQITSKPDGSSVQIDATIIWAADVELDEDGSTYKLTNPLVAYETYQISTVEEVGG